MTETPIRACPGVRDTILDESELWFSISSFSSVQGLQNDPTFAPLCDHPRFKAPVKIYDQGSRLEKATTPAPKFILTGGRMVSHYRIVEKIGAGGMGEVYLAEDMRFRGSRANAKPAEAYLWRLKTSSILQTWHLL